MVLRKSIVTSLVVLCLFLTSCLEVARGISDWTQIEDIESIEGKTHYLGDDGIKLFLPTSFKRYSSIKYLALLDSLATDNHELEIERTRLKHMREMEGNHYIYFDDSVNATYTLNTVPFTPISRQDAKYLLGLIRQNHEQLSEFTDLDYSKITAKHNDNGKVQVFKAIFKIENKKLEQQAFQHAYFISSNNKTVLINLMAPFEVYFDPFIEKMIL
ncbi:hypothetical protein [Winogradskyella alexanderae]|uniref:Uncharacterized protein n=1 Tax=Winogradskyella alexanderae TaxID=2877123 RepID=A0ABS7XS30_9FLAO|nr:hypothetical protein [Winogradskyella alexanderae]MCA0132269.1 hypothetical protein [Winogradskyella alexanderae]